MQSSYRPGSPAYLSALAQYYGSNSRLRKTERHIALQTTQLLNLWNLSMGTVSRSSTWILHTETAGKALDVMAKILRTATAMTSSDLGSIGLNTLI